MELREALGQISEIRAQMSRTQSFGGFRSLTVGFSGVLGLVAAVFQANQIGPWNGSGTTSTSGRESPSLVSSSLGRNLPATILPPGPLCGVD